MNLSKVSANGQVTVPVEIRKKLNLKKGDKILFFERSDGEVVINNASTHQIASLKLAVTAITKAQEAFNGAAKDFNVNSDDDVQHLVDEVRYGGRKMDSL